MESKTTIVTGTGHIAGRLASKIAKQLLEGQNITVVFAENIKYAFPIKRARKIYEAYLHKRCIVNPRKGPYHYVEPSKYFIRMVKRMLPHKKKKGANALTRLKVYDSCPADLFNAEKSVHPECLISYKSNPIRKNCTFGDLLKDFGWKHSEIAKEMNKKYEEEKNIKLSEKKEKEIEIETFKKSGEFMSELKKRLACIE
ncbi:60S ribosomal protein L16A [Gurleya vavrai]